jgi:DNA-binding transcriptional ArsR family regulator
VADGSVVRCRRLNTAPTVRLVLAIAFLRKLHGRPSFSYRDVYALVALARGKMSKSTLNGHVNTLAGAGLLTRVRRRGSEFQITPLGEAVFTDWGGFGQRRGRPPAAIAEATAAIASEAITILDDLRDRLLELTREP